MYIYKYLPHNRYRCYKWFHLGFWGAGLTLGVEKGALEVPFAWQVPISVQTRQDGPLSSQSGGQPPGPNCRQYCSLPLARNITLTGSGTADLNECNVERNEGSDFIKNNPTPTTITPSKIQIQPNPFCIYLILWATEAGVDQSSFWIFLGTVLPNSFRYFFPLKISSKTGSPSLST